MLNRILLLRKNKVQSITSSRSHCNTDVFVTLAGEFVFAVVGVGVIDFTVLVGTSDVVAAVTVSNSRASISTTITARA